MVQHGHRQNQLNKNLTMSEKFTKKQIEQWKEWWVLFDDKGEGKIKWSEIGAAIRVFGWAPTNKQWIDIIHAMNGGDPEFPPLMEDLEKNEIDFDTFLKVLAQVAELPSTGTAADFTEGLKVFDKEQNGYVGVVEIQQILGSLGEQLTMDEIKETFKGVEENAAGQMKYADFVDHIMKIPESSV